MWDIVQSIEIASGRAIAATLFLALLWAAEGAWPMFLGRKRRAAHYARNAALGIVNAVVVATIFTGALLFATERAARTNLGLLHWLDLPVYLEWPIAVLALDAWQYAWHVANHKVPFLWRFHAVHHSDAEMDASTAVRFHTGEIALSAIARLLVLPALGLSMLHVAVYETILLPIILVHHSNVRVPHRVDRIARMVIVTPWMHWVHHSDLQPETDSNYSSIFSFWDRLFRTLRLRPDPGNIHLGLRGFAHQEWRSLTGILGIPFIHRFRSSHIRRD